MDSDSTSVDSELKRYGLGLWSHEPGLGLGLHPGGLELTVSPVKNVQGKFKLSCAIIDKIKGRNKLNKEISASIHSNTRTC